MNKSPIEFDSGQEGIWTRWTSVRKVKEVEATNDLCAFQTAEPCAIAARIHPKAMLVILTSADEIENWMTAPTVEALQPQSLMHPILNWSTLKYVF